MQTHAYSLRQKLRNLAVLAPCGPDLTPGSWIRAVDVHKLAGGSTTSWCRHCLAHRQVVPRRRPHLRGQILWLRLDDVLGRLNGPRHHRRWTGAEEDRIRGMIGHASIEEIADALGRTPDAVRWHVYEVMRLPIDQTVAANRRLIKTAMLARLCRRRVLAIRAWVDRGCPSEIIGRRLYFDLAAVRVWLAQPDQHETWIGLHPAVHDKLRLTAADVEAIRAEQNGRAA